MRSSRIDSRAEASPAKRSEKGYRDENKVALAGRHINRLYSHSWYWTETSLQWRLCGGISLKREKCNLHLKRLSALASGPVQTSCFCRAELNSGIKFDKSTAEARRLNQTFELSSASSAVLHDFGTAVIQTSCFCRAKQNS